MGYSTTPEPHLWCMVCGRKRHACICKPKCEYNLSDDVTRKLQDWLSNRLERGCRKVQSMGWGYKLAARISRRVEDHRVIYNLETTILLPGAEPPAGEWTVYSPWRPRNEDPD